MTNAQVLKIHALLKYKGEVMDYITEKKYSIDPQLYYELFHHQVELNSEFWKLKFGFLSEYKTRYCIYKDELYFITNIYTSKNFMHIIILSDDLSTQHYVQFDEIDILSEWKKE